MPKSEQPAGKQPTADAQLTEAVVDTVRDEALIRTRRDQICDAALELFLDKGFERTRKLVLGMIGENFDMAEVEQEDRDSKSRLLEWGQKKRKRVEFTHREEHQRGRGKLYVCDVLIDGRSSGSGLGNSKKKAEQEAAQAAFRSIHARGPHAKHDHERKEEGAAAQEPLKRSRRRGGQRGGQRRSGGQRQQHPPGDGAGGGTPSPAPPPTSAAP